MRKRRIPVAILNYPFTETLAGTYRAHDNYSKLRYGNKLKTLFAPIDQFAGDKFALWLRGRRRLSRKYQDSS